MNSKINIYVSLYRLLQIIKSRLEIINGIYKKKKLIEIYFLNI